MNYTEKSCQNVKVLIMKGKTILGGIKKCANPHILRAIPHTQHNGILFFKLL